MATEGRFLPVNFDISQLSDNDKAICDHAITKIRGGWSNVLILENIEETDLVKHPNIPNIYMLREGSRPSVMSAYIAKTAGVICSTVQRKESDSWSGGRRTPKNHDLMWFKQLPM